MKTKQRITSLEHRVFNLEFKMAKIAIKKKSNPKTQEIKKMRRRGSSAKHIAKYLNISLNTVYYHLRK